MKKLPDLTHLTHSEKDEIIRFLWEQNALLRKQVAHLEARVKLLEGQLSRNSQNSSKPPSSDGYNKPKPKSSRLKGKNGRGGQKGHTGSTLRQVSTPDHIVEHFASTCTQCKNPLLIKSTGRYKARQVFDIPDLKLQVTEHRSYQSCCEHCDLSLYGEFPSSILQPVQYGPKIKSVMVYMSQYQLLPYNRVKEFFADLFGQVISQGTLLNVNQDMYYRLRKTEKEIKALLQHSHKLHVDETGCRIGKELKWLHVVSTSKLTYYEYHPKRGSQAVEAIGILPVFQGTLIHDHFKPYFKYGNHHSLCNAHHLRELTFIEEKDSCRWAKSMKAFLLSIKERVESHYKKTGSSLPKAELKHHYSRYKTIIARGKIESPLAKRDPNKRVGRTKQSDARNLLERLSRFGEAVLAFMFNPRIPFDNNQAERDIRMMKVKQKVSGCFRSTMGAKIFCRIRSYLSTTRKNDLGILSALMNGFAGRSISLPMLEIG